AERVDRRAKRAVQRGEDKLAHIARVEGEAEPPGVGEVGLWNRRGAQRSGIEFSRATWAPPRREMRELDGSSGRIVDQPRYATLTRGAQEKTHPACRAQGGRRNAKGAPGGSVNREYPPLRHLRYGFERRAWDRS